MSTMSLCSKVNYIKIPNPRIRLKNCAPMCYLRAAKGIFWAIDEVFCCACCVYRHIFKFIKLACSQQVRHSK